MPSGESCNEPRLALSDDFKNNVIRTQSDRVTFSLPLASVIVGGADSKLGKFISMFPDVLHVCLMFGDAAMCDGKKSYVDILNLSRLLLINTFLNESDSVNDKLASPHTVVVSLVAQCCVKKKWKVVSTLVMHPLNGDGAGSFISYTATSCGKFSRHFHPNADLLPWRRRGLLTTLLLVSQLVSEKFTSSSELYLQSRTSNLQTYKTLGFASVPATSLLVMASLTSGLLSEHPDLTCLCLSSCLNTSVAATRTARLDDYNGKRRTCCLKQAFGNFETTKVSSFDMGVFMSVDAFENSQGMFIARCVACGCMSDPSSLSTFESTRLYSFAYDHALQCESFNQVRRCTLRYLQQFYDDHCDYNMFIQERASFIERYMTAVKRSCCIPGCSGINCEESFLIPRQDSIEDNCSVINESALADTSPSSQRRRSSRLGALRSIALASRKPQKRCPNPTQFTRICCTNGIWHAYTKNGIHRIVSDAFISDNFTSDFISSCIQQYGVTLEIPAGRCRDLKKVPTPNVSSIGAGCFLQLSGNTCVFSSLASGLRFFGDHQACDVISKNISASERVIDRFSYAVDLLCDSTMRYTPKKFGEYHYVPTQDVSCWPTLVRLCGQDGGVGHAVTIVGNQIFDSNTVRALPLTMESLDWCCGTATQPCNFSHVWTAIRFVRSKALSFFSLCPGCRSGGTCSLKVN